MSPKLKFYISLASVTLLLIVVVAAGVWLYVSKVQGIYVELRNHQTQLQQNEKLQELLTKTRGTVRKREGDLTLIRSMLYRPGEIDLDAHTAYLNLVEALASSTGASAVTLSRTGTASPEQGMNTKFSFTTTGSFDDMVKFLAMLEELPIYTVVEQASLSGSGKNMSLNVTIAVATAL